MPTINPATKIPIASPIFSKYFSLSFMITTPLQNLICSLEYKQINRNLLGSDGLESCWSTMPYGVI